MSRASVNIKDAGLSISGKRLFEGFNLAVNKGEVVLITGASGSGKSSLFRLLLGLSEEEDGFLYSGEVSVSSRPGWVSQNPTWDLLGNWVKEDTNPEELKLFNAGELYSRRCSDLSHGEKTIVALAGAFSRDILLLDEPGVCLSAENKKLLKRLLVENKKTALIIDHTPDFLDIADTVINFDDDTPRKMSKTAAQEYLTRLPEYVTPEVCGSPLLKIEGDVNLELAAGSCLGVRGDNGSGKTSFLSALAGIRTSKRVSCTWKGKELKSIRKRKGIISYVPQEPGRFFLESRVYEQSLQWRISDEELNRFNLIQKKFSGIDFLSGGEKQRLALAGAFAAPVLIMDEPTYGLDRDSMKVLFNGIKEKCASGGIVIISSHDRRILDKIVTSEVSFAA